MPSPTTKPCPYCKAKLTTIDVKEATRIPGNDGHCYCVECQVCGSCGPQANTPEEAKQAWEER